MSGRRRANDESRCLGCLQHACDRYFVCVFLVFLILLVGLALYLRPVFKQHVAPQLAACDASLGCSFVLPLTLWSFFWSSLICGYSWSIGWTGRPHPTVLIVAFGVVLLFTLVTWFATNHAKPGFKVVYVVAFYAGAVTFVVVSIRLAFESGVSLWQRSWRAYLRVVEGQMPTLLKNGTIRLVDIPWLLEQASDWRLRRLQDLPEAAFVSPSDASMLLDSGGIGVVSYGWLTAHHPDPDGFHLDAIRRYLRRQQGRLQALFIECVNGIPTRAPCI